MPQAKRPKLTVKQAKFVKAKAEGKSGTQAYMEAYGTTNANVAKVEASRTLTKPNVQEALQAEMARQGITLEKIIKPVADALEAEKVHIVGNGEQAMAEIVPDHSIRLKASSMAQTLIGANKQTGEGNITNFVNVTNNYGDRYAD